MYGVELNKDVIIQTFKDSTEKYGRYLGTIWMDNLNINEIEYLIISYLDLIDLPNYISLQWVDFQKILNDFI